MTAFPRETHSLWSPFPHPHGPSPHQSGKHTGFDSWNDSYPFDQWQGRYHGDSAHPLPHKEQPRYAVATPHPSFAYKHVEPRVTRGSVQPGTRNHLEGGPSSGLEAYTWGSSDTVYDQHGASGHPYVYRSRVDEENSPAAMPHVESRDYPDLHPILARDSTTLLYDVRYPPHMEIPQPQYALYRTRNATRKPVAYMRIICPYIPWPIDIVIKNSAGDSPGTDGAKSASVRSGWSSDAGGVCVRDVWHALHTALQHPLTDMEWASISSIREVEDEMSRRNRALRAARWRDVSEGEARILRRVDWLGSRTKFCGLYKDQELEERLKLPFRAAVRETWVADFTWNR